VLAAYASIYPFNTVRIWLGWLIGVVEVPALGVICFWLVLQYTFGYLELTNPDGLGGVAYGAHLGGFGAGFLFVWSVLGILHAQKKYAPPSAEEHVPVADVAAPPLPPPVSGFPQPPADVYNFGQFYNPASDAHTPTSPPPVDLGSFYPRH
jgi:hypothetical protein